jgi:hypothetical protein
VFAWALKVCLAQLRRRTVKTVVVLGVVAACLMEMYKQLPTIWKVRDDFRAHQRIAAALVTQLKTLPLQMRCFSDDVAVRLLSGLSPNRFLRTAFVPQGAAATTKDFLQYLRDQQVAYLVFFPTEDSLPAKFFPELGLGAQSDQNSKFELVSFAASSFGPDVWLYRLR